MIKFIKVYQSFAALQRHLDVSMWGPNAKPIMTRSSANGQKLAGPWLVDISSLRIKTCFLQRKDEPSCRKRLRKLRQTILREVFLLGEETGEKVNPGDVVTRVKGLRDSSVQKRFQKKE